MADQPNTQRKESTVIRNVRIVATSGNTKTGVMPVTYRPVTTCPTTCAFLPKSQGGNGGCYGTGRIFALANVATDMTDADAARKLADAPRSAKYLRDRVVGDVVTDDGKFDLDYVQSIARAAATADLIAYGYTHAWRLAHPIDVLAMSLSSYVMNASCETEQDVHDAVRKGFPVTIAGDDWTEGQMIAGKRVVTCPAQTRTDVTCSSCGLCAKPHRKALVRFKIHGAAKKAATASIEARKDHDNA